jgi:hypothetical protein
MIRRRRRGQKAVAGVINLGFLSLQQNACVRQRSESQRVSSCCRVKLQFRLLILLALVVVALVNGEAQDAGNVPTQEIQVVLDKQITAWNRGDLEGFMAGYWKSPDLVYLSNKTVVRGWQTLLDRYRQFYQPPNEGKMGTLSLPEEEITILGQDSAIVWGRFLVETNDGKNRGGLYTLAMRRLPEGWRTVYDRTSIEQQPQGSNR